MKKVLFATILICCGLIGAVIGSLVCKNSEKDKSMNYAATALVESFDWRIATGHKISAFKLSREDFYQNYYHITGGDAYSYSAGPTSGNLDGIEPEILEHEFSTPDNQNVDMYEIQLDYNMPKGCALIAIIAFYEDKICMSGVHVRIENIDELASITQDSENAISPATWPLNINKQTIEAWKTNYLRLVNQNSIGQ